jgi:hypothetical protein
MVDIAYDCGRLLTMADIAHDGGRLLRRPFAIVGHCWPVFAIYAYDMP